MAVTTGSGPRRHLVTKHARPLRFALVGGIAGVIQLGALGVFVSVGMQPFLANAAGFALSAQVNFLLSQTFTWRDRRDDGQRSLLSRWATYHACISGAAVVNLAVFALVLQVAPHLLAAALGIVAGALLNFVTNDRLTFKRTAEAKRLEPADEFLALHIQ